MQKKICKCYLKPLKRKYISSTGAKTFFTPSPFTHLHFPLSILRIRLIFNKINFEHFKKFVSSRIQIRATWL